MNPPHPGELLREDVINALGLSVTETAERLGMVACRIIASHKWPRSSEP